jgi:hypothetical protein
MHVFGVFSRDHDEVLLFTINLIKLGALDASFLVNNDPRWSHASLVVARV